ncbi:hypothetical protein [Bradyrhizobium iriomotense]|uniref:hypothetical protein n=1 Tax=Bradyrhizobium iriomotense TaxID=441950 RepID=UPI0024E0479B|nr:hypothetical protein [Bradyrhizobium iriomotense]
MDEVFDGAKVGRADGGAVLAAPTDKQPQASWCRHPGDRMAMLFAAVHESVVVQGVEAVVGFCLRFRVQRRSQYLNTSPELIGCPIPKSLTTSFRSS